MYDRTCIQSSVSIDNSPQRCCRKSLFFFSLILLFLTTKALPVEDPFVFSDTLYTYIVDHGSLKKTVLRRHLRNFPPQEKNNAFNLLLDSLGYFNPDTDTLAPDSLVITLGYQAVIDTIIIQCTRPFMIDSLQRIGFPVPYNAGVVQSLARKALVFLAQRGYPFAKSSITITDSTAGRNSADSLQTPQKHMTLRFRIDVGKQCVFDAPLFMGEFKTKDKILAQDMVFGKGQTFDIRKIETSQKRLISRTYIAGVTIGAPGIVNTPAEPDSVSRQQKTEKVADTSIADSVDVVAVPLLIEDNSGMGIDGAVAYSSDADIRWSGLLTITMLNILHRGESASLFYRGEKLLQQFEIEVAKAYPFLWPLFISASFGLEIEGSKDDIEERKDGYGYLHGELKVLTQLKELWQAGAEVTGHETTIKGQDDSNVSWHFIGIDLILQRLGEPFRDRMFSREFIIRTGTGIAEKSEGRYNRWRFDFSAGSHIPLFKRQAFLGKIATHLITSDDKDSLHRTEKIRIGGYKNIRGYADNNFSFIAVGYAQTAYLFYFNPTGSVYIFMDGGIGFSEDISLDRDDSKEMFGYGLGIRVPVKFGTLSLEWARNIEEQKGLGRIHVRMRNNLSPGIQ